MNDMAIVAHDLVKRYRRGAMDTAALRGVSIGIPKGSFSCIIGPSGHGKSTLMHILGGLDRPTEGTVVVDGTDLNVLSNSRLAGFRGRKIGFVFQFFNLLQNLTAEENVSAAMMFSGVPRSRQKERSRELLSLVGLEEKLQARPGELSGGQQQRVAIARALANDPDIIMMDEPTGNLDSEAEASILDILFRLHRAGKTLLLVTHSREIAQRAERVVEIRDGRVTHEQLSLQSDQPREVINGMAC